MVHDADDGRVVRLSDSTHEGLMRLRESYRRRLAERAANGDCAALEELADSCGFRGSSRLKNALAYVRRKMEEQYEGIRDFGSGGAEENRAADEAGD